MVPWYNAPGSHTYGGKGYEGNMRGNRLRRLLEADKPSLGTHLHSTWPSMVEVVGHAGVFDYVEFEGEYAPFDLYALENFCRAAELFGLGSMIKVDFEPKRFLAQRAIGAGFESVLFADCRSAADVEACVRAVRPDTPEDGGDHGVGMRRSTYMTYGGTPEYVQALRDVVIAVMIEKKQAVDQLEALLSVPGVDMIQWGPADYCMSLGRPGAWDSKEVQAVEDEVLRTCLARGIPPRVEVERVDEANRYIDMGIRHFCLGTDLLILYNGLREQGQALRQELPFQSMSDLSEEVSH